MRLDDPYFELHRRTSGVLVVARTSRIFEGAEELRESCRRLMLALGEVRRDRSVLVVDLRRSRGRNDPEFEAAFAVERKRLYAGWAHARAICLTEVGRMHVRRHMEVDGYDWPVSCDALVSFSQADEIAASLAG